MFSSIRSRWTAAAVTAGRLGLAALAAMVLAALLAGPARANLAAVAPNDPATQVPAWFQDTNGLKLGLCLDGPPYCLTSAAEFNAPDGEAFYFQAGADLTIGAAGKAKLVLAQEATNPAGGPGAFMRVRVLLTSAAPNTTYSVAHPFGTVSITTDARGNGRSTVDTGCTVGPCASFGGALAGQLGPFLQWDPRVAPSPPANHIGDSVTPHPVVGGTRANSFTVTGPGGGTTNLFTVAGKLAGPPVAVYHGPGGLDFGNQPLTVPLAKAATITSFGVPDLGTGQSNLVVAGVGLSGPAASDYQIVSNTCSANSFPSGSGCTLGVQFTPTAAGVRTASIDIGTNAAGSVRHIALTGVGVDTSPVASANANANARSRMAIRKLRTTHRLTRSRVLRRGIRLTMRVPAGAEIVKFSVLRVRNGQVNRKPVWLAYRVPPSRAGVWRVTLDSRALRRRLKTGLYQLNVTPGVSKKELGQTSTTRIRITRR